MTLSRSRRTHPRHGDQRPIDRRRRKIIEKSDELGNHGKKARRLETMMERSSGGTESVDIAAEAARIVDRCAEVYPSVAVHTSIPDSVRVSTAVGVEFGIESLFEHNTSDQPAVLRQGEESSLEHGSGIGLWLAYWAIENSGGDLQFPEADGGPVCVRLAPAQ